MSTHQLRNAIYKLHTQTNSRASSSHKGTTETEPLQSISQAQEQWELSINDELQAIARERHQPLARLHPEEGAMPALVNSNPPPLRFLFDTEDLLDAIVHIESPNRNTAISSSSLWGAVKLQLHTKSMHELQQQYAELAPHHRQIGLDDKIDDSDRFMEQRHVLGKKVIEDGYIPVARQYAKFGAPASLRPAIWRIILGLPERVSEAETTYYAKLREHVEQIELLTDELFQMDVQHIADNDHYFPFEELLHNVVLAFSRDPWVLQNSHVRTHKPLLGHACSAQPTGTAIPPCGVQPFRGFVNYAAPLTFLFQAEEPAYFVLRAMYARLWCNVNVMRSQPDTLLPLCKLFEELVQHHHPSLFFHMLQIGVTPLQIALPWIQFGFVGYLEVDQVLLLWDRLLGFEQLSLLSVLAAAIFVYRSNPLMHATDLNDVRDIFTDGSMLRVVPLLQHFLFPGVP